MSNPTVAFTIPVARPVEESWHCLSKFAKLGYLIAVWVDDPESDLISVIKAAAIPAMVLTGKYPGYGASVNALAKQVLHHYPDIKFCLTGGDDLDPVPGIHADIIGAAFEKRLGGTFGVLQPTGDRFAGGSIDRIAGSPWMGRDWCLRAHQGMGPLCPEFFHMSVDCALLYAAEQEGVYHRVPELTQRHNHFCREGEQVNWGAVIPDHLKAVNTPLHFKQSDALLQRFKRDYETKWRPLPEVPNV